MHAIKGFTLVELLITVALIGIVAGIVTVNFSGSLSSSQKKKSKAHIGSVLRMVEQQKSIGKTHTQIAEALSDTSFELWEKVVGSTPYLIDYMKRNSPDEPCDGSGGKIYKFLDILDGNSQTPTWYTSPVTLSSADEHRVYCIVETPTSADIAIRVTDDVWWCANINRGGYRGYFTKDSDSTKKLMARCPHSIGDTRTVLVLPSEKTNSILKAKIDDFLD